MSSFIPAFEGTWSYQSFLTLPTEEELAAKPGSSITAKKWAKGKLLLADGVNMEAAGKLEFLPGVELVINLNFTPAADGGPAKIEIKGIGRTGPTQGSVYDLTGWAFPAADGSLASMRGAIRCVRGPDTAPDRDVGVVGLFVATK